MFGLSSVVGLALKEAAGAIKEFVSDVEDEAHKENLLLVAEEMSGMRGVGGVALKAHKRGLRVYQNCFIGREAVEWLLYHKVVQNTQAAINYGNRMARHQIFACVSSKRKKFSNDNRLFKFNSNFQVPEETNRQSMAVDPSTMTPADLTGILESARMDYAPGLYETEFTGQALIDLLVKLGLYSKRTSAKICSIMLENQILQAGDDPSGAGSAPSTHFDATAYYRVSPRFEPANAEPKLTITQPGTGLGGPLSIDYSLSTAKEDGSSIDPHSGSQRRYKRQEGSFDSSTVFENCPRPEQWEFVQSFGDDASVYEFPNADDLITALEFNSQGKYLAIGDRAGRVSVVEQLQNKESVQSSALEYQFRGEFQCFEPEFDTLMAVNVSPRIVSMKWWPETQTPALLTANSETVKLWRLGQKWQVKRPMSPLHRNQQQNEEEESNEAGISPTKKQEFRKGHSFNIHTVSVNSDMETFLSCDDLNVYIWNINRSDECFNVINLKPQPGYAGKEPNGPVDCTAIKDTITSASFHPFNCNELMYGDSGGVIRIADMRERALLDNCAAVTLRAPPAKHVANKTYTPIANSISDAKFTQNGRFILSRDLMRVRIWDLNMPNKVPFYEQEVHPFLWKHMSTMAHNDALFDRFTVSSDATGRNYVTGSYNGTFCVRSRTHKTTTTIKAAESKSSKFISVKEGDKEQSMKNLMEPLEIPVNSESLSQKILHTAWHPCMQSIAVAGLYKLWIYQARKPLTT